MPKPRDRDAARAIPEISCRKPLTGARGAPPRSAAVTSRAAKGASLNDVMSPSDPDANLLALKATLNRQHEIIAAIEEEGRQLPKRITDASRDQERRLEQALDRRTETLNCVVAARASTPDGLRVKAEALVLVALRYKWSQEGKALEEVARYGGTRDHLALSLACDVLTWSIGAGARPPIATPCGGELNTMAVLIDRLRAALPGQNSRWRRVREVSIGKSAGCLRISRPRWLVSNNPGR